MMKLTLISRTPGLTQVSCQGHITQLNLHAGDDPLRTVLDHEDCSHSILMDLSQAQFIDSSGVGWMLKCHKHCKQAGGRIVYHSAPPLVRQTLDLLQMGKVLCLAKDAKTARAIVEEQLQIQLVSSSQDLQRLRVSGALTEKHLQKSGHDPLELAIGAAAYAQRLLADLSKLNELDNAGLNWMMKTAERCQAAGGEIVFYALPSSLRAIVEHSPDAAEMKIADNEAAAALQLKGR